MKTILFALALTCSSATFAQAVYVRPTIFNFGNSIQVQVNNNTEFNIHCSGTVQAHTMLGRSETFFYNDMIRSRSFSSRNFMSMNMGDRITSTFDFIHCNRVN